RRQVDLGRSPTQSGAEFVAGLDNIDVKKVPGGPSQPRRCFTISRLRIELEPAGRLYAASPQAGAAAQVGGLNSMLGEAVQQMPCGFRPLECVAESLGEIVEYFDARRLRWVCPDVVVGVVLHHRRGILGRPSGTCQPFR